MKLDKQLKKLLQDADITVAQLSRATGVPAKTIYHWMGGQKPRDITSVKKIADHLKVSIDWLCFGTESHSRAHGKLEQHMDEVNAGVFEVVLRRVGK